MNFNEYLTEQEINEGQEIDFMMLLGSIASAYGAYELYKTDLTPKSIIKTVKDKINGFAKSYVDKKEKKRVDGIMKDMNPTLKILLTDAEVKQSLENYANAKRGQSDILFKELVKLVKGKLPKGAANNINTFMKRWDAIPKTMRDRKTMGGAGMVSALDSKFKKIYNIK